MFIFTFLIFFGFSSKKKDEIVEMDGRRFRLSVLHREPSDTWVSLLSSQDLEGHTEANTEFDKAFAIGKGFLKFAYLDTSKNVNIPKRLKLKTLPQYCIFYTASQTCIPANISARELINLASYYLPDFTEKASLQWLKKDESNPVALLFTDKKETPALWAAISNVYHKSMLRIGISNDHNFAKELGIESDFPVIIFHNYTHNIIYEGKNDFLTLKVNIKKFMQKKFFKVRSGLSVRPIREYNNNYQGTDTICIINIADDLNPDLEKIRKKFTTSKFDFFYGEKSENLHIPETKKGDILIIFNEIGKYINVDSLEKLESIILELLAGNTNFPNMKELIGFPTDEDIDYEL
ncbi:hypothetical protein M9Y10_023497 [Tritrichomonas musculus]|uniref:Thioredoxin domain-containing protein n=1 Tax=Tritrichomonas musculus TaxID=1915356 RepID=A0ABR2KYF9_9EUKA